MPTLQIQLLGEFKILYDEVPITTLNSARLQALLAYLLLHRNAPQSRQHLAFLFWPDSTEKQARTNLRHQFHLLRQAHPIFEPLLLSDAQTVQWESALPLQLDVADFESASGSAASLRELQTAVALYHGDLLPSCYDDWILPLRERLRQRFLESMERIIGSLEQTGDYNGAIRYAEQMNRFDPLHEASYRQLMRLYAISGDQTGIERIYQACVALMQRELAAPPTPATQKLYRQLIGIETPLRERHNLVASLTPFVGREAELTKLTSLLADPACRLLTILGTGGIGKTRLALEAAQRQIGRFLHGIYVVPFAAISTPEFMVSTIADQLKFTFYGPQEPSIQLLNYLREKEMLLVLDSIEHLLPGSDLLVKILQHAPAIKLLITSRERLKIEGEWLHEIQGLRVPLGHQVEHGEEFSAIQLFLQSARRIQPDFDPSADDIVEIIRLCQLVEGMPLGIELAASWVRILSCAEIVQELTQSLDFLASESPTTLPRHRSIRAVIDHSWNLLSLEEQRVFQCLSVFQGGFRREAAVQVAGASLPLLAALVDKSLVRWDRLGRYEMHELIRQYAAEKLAENPSAKTLTQDRHGRYYLEFLRQQEPRLKNSQQQDALAEIKREIDNVRLAWQLAVAQKRINDLKQVAQVLYLFYEDQGWFYEAESLFRHAIELLEIEQSSNEMITQEKELTTAGQLRALQSWFLLRLGQVGQAKKLIQDSIILLRRCGAQLELAHALQYNAMIVWATGEYSEARSLLDESLTIHSKNKDQWLVALCQGCLGLILQSLGNYREARNLILQALSVFKEMGDSRMIAMSLNYLSPLAYALGEVSEAKYSLQESMHLSRMIGDRFNTLLCLNFLGAIAYLEGPTEWEKAKRLHEESLTISKDLGDRWQMVNSLNHLGNVTCALGDYADAQGYFLAALRTAKEEQIPPGTLGALIGLATLLCQQSAVETDSARTQRKEQAVELLVLILSHPASDQETKEKAQRLWSQLETELTPHAMAVAQERGQSQTLEEIAAVLLTENR